METKMFKHTEVKVFQKDRKEFALSRENYGTPNFGFVSSKAIFVFLLCFPEFASFKSYNPSN